MAKFLDKKERAIDFKLTPYGKHKLSVGSFKPTYYAFYDNGVIYDISYATDPYMADSANQVIPSEQQNEIHDRIKNKTQYLEGILSFEELENTVPSSTLLQEEHGYGLGAYFAIKPPGSAGYRDGALDKFLDKYESADDFYDIFEIYEGGVVAYGGKTWRKKTTTSMFDLDIEASKHIPRPDVFQFDSAIGDAKFDGKNTQAAPAWKVVACQGEIIKSTQKDTAVYIPSEHKDTLSGKEYNIPQLNIDLYYKKIVDAPKSVMWANEIPVALNETPPFADGNVIRLENHDLVIYADEVNTELLTENFDIEVFKMNEEAGIDRGSIGTIAFNPNATPSIGDIIEISDGTNTRKFEFIKDGLGTTPPTATDTVAVVISAANTVEGVTLQNRYGTLYNLISAINNEYGTREQTYPTEPNVGTDSDGSNLSLPYLGKQWHNGRCGTYSWVYAQLGTDIHKCWILGADVPATAPVVQASTTITLGDEAGNKSLIATLTSPSGKNRTITYTPAGTSKVTVSGFKNGIEYKITELERKYFYQTAEQIVDGFMKLPNPVSKNTISATDMDKDTVEYYFDVAVDSKMDKTLGCQCANAFNKNSYYVDIDFECDEEHIEPEYYDIYGSVTVPEICLDDKYDTAESCEDEDLED
jgi:hypothetical protein